MLLLASACAPAAPSRAEAPVGEARHETRSASDAGASPAHAADEVDGSAKDRRPRFAVGDSVQLFDHSLHEDRDRADCPPFPSEGEAGRSEASAQRSWSLGTYAVGYVVATSGCSDGLELLLVAIDGYRVPLLDERLRRVRRGCPEAVRAMLGEVVGAWDACYANVPAKIRGTGNAEVRVELDEDGKVLRVAWQGGTGWGPQAATCMLRATEHAALDGRECAGESIRLEKWYVRGAR